MALNEKYSYKDFTNQSFTKVSANDFNNTEIVGTCFHQEFAFTDVFPPAMEGVTFAKCNLDNCNIPSGNTIIDSSVRQFLKQNDGEKWIVDLDLNPVSPVNSHKYDEFGLSKDPKDISLVERESVVMEKEYEKMIAEYEGSVSIILGKLKWQTIM